MEETRSESPYSMGKDRISTLPDETIHLIIYDEDIVMKNVYRWIVQAAKLNVEEMRLEIHQGHPEALEIPHQLVNCKSLVLSGAPDLLGSQPPHLFNLQCLLLKMRSTRGCLLAIAYLLKIYPLIKVILFYSKQSNLVDVEDDWEAGLSSRGMLSRHDYVNFVEMVLRRVDLSFRASTGLPDGGRQMELFREKVSSFLFLTVFIIIKAIIIIIIVVVLPLLNYLQWLHHLHPILIRSSNTGEDGVESSSGKDGDKDEKGCEGAKGAPEGNSGKNVSLPQVSKVSSSDTEVEGSGDGVGGGKQNQSKVSRNDLKGQASREIDPIKNIERNPPQNQGLVGGSKFTFSGVACDSFGILSSSSFSSLTFTQMLQVMPLDGPAMKEFLNLVAANPKFLEAAIRQKELEEIGHLRSQLQGEEYRSRELEKQLNEAKADQGKVKALEE
ncbi:uncharacterized protein LOC113318537 [Papaver somniferum]|uniref:uncharacterized protein LOC113318537 n=1 Tax=Papaver somniferum TaxID=3469 RepID=UPI000E705351|nr:uncharacterized protein LOC113318537 [Papaver somniferum]